VGRDMLWQAQWAIAAGWVARRVPAPGSTVVPFQKRKRCPKNGKCCKGLVHERATKTAGRHWRERRIQEAGRTRPPARRQRSLKHLEGSILEGGREGKSEERGRPYRQKRKGKISWAVGPERRGEDQGARRQVGGGRDVHGSAAEIADRNSGERESLSTRSRDLNQRGHHHHPVKARSATHAS